MQDPYGVGIKTTTGGFLLNCLTVGALLLTLGIGAAYAAVFVNPYLPFNPYPPPTLPPTLGPPTITPTAARQLGATWTPTPSRTPGSPQTATPSPAPSETPGPGGTSTTGTPEGLPFDLQPGSPVLTPNIANDQGCQWMGVGGQIFDLEGNPVTGLGIRLEGSIGERTITMDSISGTAPNLGPAGYVFNVADQPIASQETLWIQVRDNGGVPLSEQVFLSTSAACDENFVLVNWKQIR